MYLRTGGWKGPCKVGLLELRTKQREGVALGGEMGEPRGRQRNQVYKGLQVRKICKVKKREDWGGRHRVSRGRRERRRRKTHRRWLHHLSLSRRNKAFACLLFDLISTRTFRVSAAA